MTTKRPVFENEILFAFFAIITSKMMSDKRVKTNDHILKPLASEILFQKITPKKRLSAGVQ